MIRIAAGERLPFGQDEVRLAGHAIEARLYAEDPSRGFLPSIGRLKRYIEPIGEGVRVDSGVYEGAEISIHYDPMIAKVVGAGANREQARERLVEALDAFVVRGLNHNGAFLSALLRHPRFVEGRLSTDFIGQEFPGGHGAAKPPTEETAAIVAIAAVIARRIDETESAIAGQLPGQHARAGDDWAVVIGEQIRQIHVALEKLGYRVRNGKAAVLLTTSWRPGLPLFHGTFDGRPVTVQVDRHGLALRLTHHGVSLAMQVLPPRAAELLALMPAKAEADQSRHLLSPMPGLLVSVAVQQGQEVKVGEELAVVEAMKMMNVLKAERDGTVAKLCAKPGDSLAVDQVILEFA
jgi:propionyl-CoA carboxylase alpha subunit